MSEVNTLLEKNGADTAPLTPPADGTAEISQGLVIPAFGDFSPDYLLDERALGQALNVSPRSIRRMVMRGELPAGVKLGGRKVWLCGKVREYLHERADKLVQAARKRAARIDNIF